MKKGIFGVLCLILGYCLYNLLLVHEALIQIEHKEPLHIISENSSSIHTEQNENGFVTDIILPSGVFYRQMQLTVKSDIPQNAVIKFAGPKVIYRNSYKKYIIYYKNVNITHVNTDEILPKVKTVSFLKPLSCSVDNLTTVTVDFAYKTGFVLRNMSLVCFIMSIPILLFLIGYIAIFLYKSKRVRNTLSYCFDSEDFLSLVINSYRNIRNEYKICFWINFILLNIVYLYLNINFLFGNHDWWYLTNDISSDYYSRIGRFSIFLLNGFIEHKTLPVINNCLGFAFISLTPILLVKYWDLPRTIFNIFAVSIIILLHPLLLAVLYFLHLSFAYSMAPLLLVTGLIFSEKQGNKNFFLATVVLLLGISDYNVCINTIGILFGGKILLAYTNGLTFKLLLKKYGRSFGIICFACIIYFIIIQCFKYTGYGIEGYNASLLAGEDILPRMMTVFKQTFKHFYLTYPFVDLKLLTLLSLLFALMLLVIFFESQKRNIIYFFITIILMFCTVISSNIIYYISKSNHALNAYTSYFTLPFLYTVAVAYILNSGFRWAKNLLLILLVPIIFFSILRDFDFQKYWKLGFDGDNYLISRVVDRIEGTSTFSYENEYDIIFIGFYKSYNSYYYKTETDLSVMTVSNPFIFIGGIGGMFKHYMPQLRYKHDIVFNNKEQDIFFYLKDIPKEKIFNLKPWPHKNSVVIYENKIIVCWQEKELEYVKKVLMEQPENQSGE